MNFIERERHRRNWLKHALQADLAGHSYVRRQPLDFYTCARCGRIAFRHKRRDWVACPVCGYHGPAGPKMRTWWDTIDVGKSVVEEVPEPEDELDDGSEFVDDEEGMLP